MLIGQNSGLPLPTDGQQVLINEKRYFSGKKILWCRKLRNFHHTSVYLENKKFQPVQKLLFCYTHNLLLKSGAKSVRGGSPYFMKEGG